MAERSYNGRNIFRAENGDFESADALSTKWGVGVGFAGAGTTITKGTDSTNYYKITWGTGGGYIDNESVTYVPVRPNTQYTWSVRTRTNYVSGDATNGGRVSIVEYNAARVGVTSVGNTSTPYVKTTQDWTTYTYTFTTRNATNSVRFNIRLYAQQGAGTLKMDMDVDDISLTEVLPARTTATSRSTIIQQRVATRDMGTALRFDGVDDSVTATDTSNPFTSGGTLASWFILSTTAANQSIIGNSLNLNGFAMIYRSAGLRTEAGNGTNTVTTAGVRLVPGRAYFGVSTFDGVNIQTYINGVLADAPVARTSIGPSVSAITIAKGAGGSFDYMRGTIDESRVWNRALTATEIANMYYNNIVPRNGLVAEYLFNEGSGTTALDTSGNGNVGTITGATYTTDVPLKIRTTS